MRDFKFEVTVTAETVDQALRVMSERTQHDEDYGFDYQVDFSADRTAFRWTYADLAAIAGRELTDDEVVDVARTIDFMDTGDDVAGAVRVVCRIEEEE